MKKMLLGMAISAALLGCGGESLEEVKKDAVVVIPASTVIFDPSAGALSIPNDLLFQGTTDGTLNIPVKDPANIADPLTAISRLDGWSTNTAFTLAIDLPQGVTLDAASVQSPDSIHIYEAIMGGDLKDADCNPLPQGAGCKIVGELTFGVDYVTKVSGDNVAVIPLKPLKAATTYLLTLTNNLKDSTGSSVDGSSSYNLVKQDINTLPLITDAQLQLQGLINSFESVISTQGIAKENIIYSMAMTTQSVGQVTSVAKQLLLSGLSATPIVPMPVINVQDTTMSVADVLVDAGALDPNDAQSIALYSSANYLRGSVSLPYYLHTPSPENKLAPLNTWMNALCDSGAALAGLTAAYPELIPEAPINTNDAICMSFGLRDFSTSENPVLANLDTERNLTKFNPIPKINTFQDIDVQMTTPDVNVANAIRPGLGLPPLVKPEGGWPVVILQHGIPSKKEDMLTTTAMLSLFGIASVAIDYPLFNSRGFDYDNDGTKDIDASVNPLDYINLQSYTTTSSNGKQAIIDLLGLRFGLNFLNGADIDKSKVYFTGISLGSIGGAPFLAMANSPVAGQPDQVNDMFKVQAATLSVPMQGLGFGAIIESNTFAPLLQSVLAYGGDAGFQAYFAEQNAGELTPANGAVFLGFLIQTYGTYQTTLSPEDAAALAGLMVEAATAFQMAVDDGDPMNYAAILKATQTPLLLQEVVGDGGDNLPDQVLPNVVPSSPVSGTEPLIALLGLEGVSSTLVDQQMPVSGVVRMTAGHHSSLINPGQSDSPDAMTALRAFSEMQSQMVNYISSNGHMIYIKDTEIVKQD
ncbi:MULTISPECIES: VolA/Pla-1 family phospholipase [unclassified Pseudoalteromonas]|uniref:VolA/Pla-1 family phospholipase n=1 Tax=unclassified Pseudoalteromonas TaxID=194690 RepID=UPI0005A6C00A|nr:MULTISPECIES: VolA/Pla-1 family phospholipase [unclassified Pseudoalteromonas]